MPRARRNRRAAARLAAASPLSGSSASSEAAEQVPAIEVVELEQPFDQPYRFQALKEAYEPGKQRCTNAYDDIVAKRRKIDPQLGVQPMLESTGRARKNRSTTASSQAAKKARVHAFVVDQRARHENEDERVLAPSPKGFAKLPAEIRAIIFRYLLVNDNPVLVFGGWGYVYPRGRPNLHTGVLGVCRDFYEQGLRTLYGENTFRYRTRDPSSTVDKETRHFMSKVFEQDGHTIPVHKHGHLIRNVEIDIEANRMREAKNRFRVVEALARFLPSTRAAISAQLRTVTLEIYLETRKTLRMEISPTQPRNSYPAVDMFVSHADVLACLHKINCQFVRIVAHRSQDCYLYETVVDRRPHFTALDAARGSIDDIWSGDAPMLESRRKDADQSKARLNAMAGWLRKLIKEPGNVLEQTSVFRAYVPEPEERDRKSRTRASNRAQEQARPAAGGLTEESLECVAGPSHWASSSGPDDDENWKDRVIRFMGPRSGAERDRENNATK